ncbi:peptidyl-prolyl cis-trans isomerase FKBP3-like isoform X1 [Stigmatopora argus]
MNQEVVWESIAKQLRIDDLPTKDPIKLSQDNAGHSFLNVRRLLGNIKNVAKKEQLFDPISSCLSANVFLGLKPQTMEEVTSRPKKSRQKLWMRVHPSLPNVCDKTSFPKKSDTVCWWRTWKIDWISALEDCS